jgi:thioredoxin-like negative regulator of GroEL
VKGLVAALLLTGAVSGGEADLKTTSGAPFSVSELLARGPVVLVFWNSWLPGSQEFLALLPEVETAAERHGWPCALIVFQDTSPEAAGKLPGGVATFPRVLDRRGELVRRFQVTRAPAVLLVEASGNVRARAGPAPEEVRELVRGMANR